MLEVLPAMYLKARTWSHKLVKGFKGGFLGFMKELMANEAARMIIMKLCSTFVDQVD